MEPYLSTVETATYFIELFRKGLTDREETGSEESNNNTGDRSLSLHRNAARPYEPSPGRDRLSLSPRSLAVVEKMVKQRVTEALQQQR